MRDPGFGASVVTVNGFSRCPRGVDHPQVGAGFAGVTIGGDAHGHRNGAGVDDQGRIVGGSALVSVTTRKLLTPSAIPPSDSDGPHHQHCRGDDRATRGSRCVRPARGRRRGCAGGRWWGSDSSHE